MPTPADPAIAPPVAPPATSPAKPAPTAEALYRAADRALASRDPATADRALGRLVSEFPASPLVDQALYERARIAYEQRAWSAARRHLDRLAAIPHTALAEPGKYLTCRIAVEARDGEAASCLAEYRKLYPRAPHELDVLALLVGLAHASGGCPAAAPLVGELVRGYPRSRHAAAWLARCPASPTR